MTRGSSADSIINVERARAEVDHATMEKVGVDETASKRGHHYSSLFVNLEEACVLFATEGRDAGVLRSFRGDFEAHGGSIEGVGELSMDMSPAYIKGSGEHYCGDMMTAEGRSADARGIET